MPRKYDEKIIINLFVNRKTFDYSNHLTDWSKKINISPHYLLKSWTFILLPNCVITSLQT